MFSSQAARSGTEADFLPLVKEAKRRLMGDRRYWNDRLGNTAHMSAFHAVGISAEGKRALDLFHAPLSWASDGRPAQRAPHLKLTSRGVPQLTETPTSEYQSISLVCKQTSVSACSHIHSCRPRYRKTAALACYRTTWRMCNRRFSRSGVSQSHGDVRGQDLRMCETCFKVAARMHSCKGCHNAWLCGAECHRAAWKAGHRDVCQVFKTRLAGWGMQSGPGTFQPTGMASFMLQVRICLAF